MEPEKICISEAGSYGKLFGTYRRFGCRLMNGFNRDASGQLLQANCADKQLRLFECWVLEALRIEIWEVHLAILSLALFVLMIRHRSGWLTRRSGQGT
jgi:hypothetical protein